MFRINLLSFLLCTLSVSVHSFVLPCTKGSRAVIETPRLVAKSSRIQATEVDEDVQTELTDRGLLKRDRYVATNRFAVRKGKAAKFEQRWATRKSRLATLDGFQYFHLMRRVQLQDDGVTTTYDEGSGESQFGNYVSFTIWRKKSHFSAWRKGDAFIEAHGGTSIGAFMSTMVNSALVLQGPPKPAFYDGLMLQSLTPPSMPEVVDGWRSVEADGKRTLPTECFIACNQFWVPLENAKAFETRWADRESKLKECDGFICFSLLRRDGQAKGHGTVPMTDAEPTYQSTTVWRDRQSFEAWRKGPAFGEAHGKPSNGNERTSTPPKPLWSRPPEPVFYEGTLVISSPEGA
jgi:heme-degrading monooxygenase HmoA